jgi:hypothetical protein
MKKTISIVLLLLVTVGMYAQDGINYKALIKDNLGAVVANQTIDVRFTIIADTGPTNVYLETHTGATTDAYGIVILTIGDGTSSDTFADIDWSSDTHSLKVEIDIEQDASFVDLGTTQFMAVPYALHAKTAEISGTTNYVPKFIDGVAVGDSQIFDDGTNVGIGTTTPSHNLEVKVDGLGFSQTTSDGTKKIGTYAGADGLYLQTHTDDALNFATNNSLAQMTLNANGNLGIGIVTATAKLDIAGDVKIADGTQGAGKILTSDADGLASWQTPGTCGLSIGDTHQGGIIFYLDASGCHGLIAAPSDQSTGIAWWNGSYVDTYAYGNGIGAGEGNSQGIRRWQGTCSSCYASELCQDLSLGGYTDWYLPSKYELNLMYENIGQGDALGLGNIGNFVNSYYWSSTEGSPSGAWGQSFSVGSQLFGDKVNSVFVRAVRAF